MNDTQKRTWVEVDLGAIGENVKAMREKLPEGCRFLGVVKADAYGHGAVEVARYLETLGVEYLAVACLDELRELRTAGIGLPVLILGVTPAEYAPELCELNATQAVGSVELARGLNKALEGTDRKLKIHMKLETGMGRTGFRTWGGDSLAEELETVTMEHLDAEGVFTHFCVSDADEPVRQFTATQFARFTEAIDRIEARWGLGFKLRHCTNSGAMLSFPETYLDMVRPGVSLYGLYPGSERGTIALRPAMALYSRVYALTEHHAGDTIGYGRTYTCDKDMRVAVLPIGYADGLHRSLSNRLEVWLGGKRCRQIGRICMDMCMVDLTDLPGVQPGDEVEIFGEHIPVRTLTDAIDTITYELLCAMSRRVPRIYTRGGERVERCLRLSF